MSAKTIVITLKSDGKVLASVDVVRGCDPILIGRSRACSLRAPGDDNSVSGRHARLFWKGSSLYLEDMQSRNGVFFNGKRIEKPIKVEPDGLYAIGNCLLVANALSGGLGKAAQKCHRLEFLNGDRARQIVDIKASPDSKDGGFTIGLDPSCDICLTDMLVSRRHAKLTVRQNGDCWITDEGSRNGTYVNGEKLGVKERLLRDGDKISIAYFDMRFLDRTVSHTRTHFFANACVLFILVVILSAGYCMWRFNPNRRTAADYRTLALKAAAQEQFEQALRYLDDAVMAKDASDEKMQNAATKGQVTRWKDTFERWKAIRESFAAEHIRDARVKLFDLLSETYAWDWNSTTALSMRKDAEFALSLMRLCTDASDFLKDAEQTVMQLSLLDARIAEISRFIKEKGKTMAKYPYLAKPWKYLKGFESNLSSIRAGIKQIDMTLDQIDSENADFKKISETFEKIAVDESLSAGVRNYANSLIPVCRAFEKTQLFLERERVLVTDMDFLTVNKAASALPLPSKDDCAQRAKFSDMRVTFQKRHEAYQQEVAILGPMVRNLEAAGVRNDEKGHLLTFTVSPATWSKALSFDCFRNHFPLSSRVDPTGVYDELVGIEYTYENLRELPKPPERKTSVLMSFVPKCQTTKAAFEQVRTFLAFMDRPESKDFRTGKLGRLYTLGAQILSDRDKLIAMLKKWTKDATSERAKIVAGYYAEYFSAEPSYADLRSLEMQFRKLQRQITELNERYEAEPDPEKRLKLRKEILEKGIPGMEAVRARWVEVDAE